MPAPQRLTDVHTQGFAEHARAAEVLLSQLQQLQAQALAATQQAKTISAQAAALKGQIFSHAQEAHAQIDPGQVDDHSFVHEQEQTLSRALQSLIHAGGQDLRVADLRSAASEIASVLAKTAPAEEESRG